MEEKAVDSEDLIPTKVADKGITKETRIRRLKMIIEDESLELSKQEAVADEYNKRFSDDRIGQSQVSRYFKIIKVGEDEKGYYLIDSDRNMKQRRDLVQALTNTKIFQAEYMVIIETERGQARSLGLKLESVFDYRNSDDDRVTDVLTISDDDRLAVFFSSKKEGGKLFKDIQEAKNSEIK